MTLISKKRIFLTLDRFIVGSESHLTDRVPKRIGLQQDMVDIAILRVADSTEVGHEMAEILLFGYLVILFGIERLQKAKRYCELWGRHRDCYIVIEQR